MLIALIKLMLFKIQLTHHLTLILIYTYNNSSQTKINDDSNLPVIYKKKKTVPLPFILLIFLVIFYSVYMMSENLSDINSDRFTKDLNNLIDIFVRKIYYFFTI